MTDYTFDKETGRIHDESGNYIDQFDTIEQAQIFYPTCKEDT